MRRSLLKKPTTIHIEIDGGAWYGLESTNAEICNEEGKVTLHLDLSKNFRARNKLSHQYTDALELAERISMVTHLQLDAHGPIMNGLVQELIRSRDAGTTPQVIACISLGQFGDHSFGVAPENDETNLDLTVKPGSYVSLASIN